MRIRGLQTDRRPQGLPNMRISEWLLFDFTERLAKDDAPVCKCAVNSLKKTEFLQRHPGLQAHVASGVATWTPRLYVYSQIANLASSVSSPGCWHSSEKRTQRMEVWSTCSSVVPPSFIHRWLSLQRTVSAGTLCCSVFSTVLMNGHVCLLGCNTVYTGRQLSAF